MSLAFDGTTAAATELEFAAGGAAGINSGAYTVLVLWQFEGNTTIFNGVDSGGFAQRNMVIDTGQIFLTVGANGVDLPGTPTNGDWFWLGVTKAAGSGVAERAHIAAYDGTGTFTWTHSTPTGTTRNDFTAAVDIFIGGWGNGGVKGHGAVAVAAAFTSALTDAEVEAACTDAFADLVSAGPAALWSMEESVAGSAIQDSSTTGTADESNRGSGVTTSADPSNYSFSTGIDTGTGSAAFGALTATAAGLVAVNGTGAAALGVLAARASPDTSAEVDIEAISQALADAAGTIPGLRGYPSVLGSINPPVFAPTEFEIAYHQTFGGLLDITFTCGVFTSVGDTTAGRKALMRFLAPAGSRSVLAALESDKTLGGACKTLVVRRVRGAYRLFEIGGVEYLGALIDVEVWA